MATIASRRNRGIAGEHLCNYCDACNNRVTPKLRRILRRREDRAWRREVRQD